MDGGSLWYLVVGEEGGHMNVQYSAGDTVRQSDIFDSLLQKIYLIRRKSGLRQQLDKWRNGLRSGLSFMRSCMDCCGVTLDRSVLGIVKDVLGQS
jgi:hypothetical protein